jgi:hypothetical protein
MADTLSIILASAAFVVALVSLYLSLVCASLDHHFDEWAALWADRRYGRTAYGLFERTCPVTAGLLQNGISGRYSGAALLNIPDPDDGERKW